MIAEVVEGVSVPDILQDLPHVRTAYLRAARRLEERGCSAIVSNCGYSVLYREAIASSASVPSLMSSLLLLPVLAAVTPADQKIAIICFDSTALSEAHLQASWPQGDHERILKVGIEQTEAWRLINRADAIYDWDLIGATLNQVCRQSLYGEKLGAVIVECCAFSSFVPQIQRLLQRPTFDIISAATALLPSQ
ncbi:MAG: hypothetical protein EOS41_28360 [Mesorhizobium sp.]|uniref:hypothetical protein n=1 Tax=Mesorhizobium sp. TaxID=1871066 RepID=UPI000FEAB33C|nr:hypothetical protein [Mesorhizobium sp.]RWE20562.1 MAG: hypothetical protein EOS41_28360 [Mesorhizobium sp.]